MVTNIIIKYKRFLSDADVSNLILHKKLITFNLSTLLSLKALSYEINFPSVTYLLNNQSKIKSWIGCVMTTLAYITPGFTVLNLGTVSTPPGRHRK